MSHVWNVFAVSNDQDTPVWVLVLNQLENLLDCVLIEVDVRPFPTDVILTQADVSLSNNGSITRWPLRVRITALIQLFADDPRLQLVGSVVPIARQQIKCRWRLVWGSSSAKEPDLEACAYAQELEQPTIDRAVQLIKRAGFPCGEAALSEYEASKEMMEAALAGPCTPEWEELVIQAVEGKLCSDRARIVREHVRSCLGCHRWQGFLEFSVAARSNPPPLSPEDLARIMRAFPAAPPSPS